MNFEQLTHTIKETHILLSQQASKSVDLHLTLRNWLIGLRVQEYEQKGEDRAQYGDRLISTLANELAEKEIPGCSESRLHAYRLFYKAYPEILVTMSAELSKLFHMTEQQKILVTLSSEFQPAKTNENTPKVPMEILLKNISYSAFELLARIEEPLKRVFYEVECMKGRWSTRELRRQINTLYYERSAYSTDKKKLSDLVNNTAEIASPRDFIKDPYVFEFLGLKPKDALRENDLRDALLDKLQDFLLEMGKGFCFEARNKRILIGDNYCFVDIVLYNRIIKRSILIELKVEAAKHENIGQLNTYLNYYKKHEMHQGDNPPIGILLCTHKDEALMEYALMDMTNEVFVSSYQFMIPEMKKLQHFVEESLHELKDKYK